MEHSSTQLISYNLPTKPVSQKSLLFDTRVLLRSQWEGRNLAAHLPSSNWHKPIQRQHCTARSAWDSETKNKSGRCAGKSFRKYALPGGPGVPIGADPLQEGAAAPLPLQILRPKVSSEISRANVLRKPPFGRRRRSKGGGKEFVEANQPHHHLHTSLHISQATLPLQTLGPTPIALYPKRNP